MMPPQHESFQGNRLSVVTFNFDRSFERRLFRALKAGYGIADQDVPHLAKSVPVWHIHGKLGDFGWMTGTGRVYGAVETVADVVTYSKQIRLLDDEIDQTVREGSRMSTRSGTGLLYRIQFPPGQPWAVAS